MDEETDPIYQFFSATELESSYALYTVLSLPTPPSTASKDEIATALSSVGSSDIRSAYRRAALKYHPDKHASKSEEEKKAMEQSFQKVGFAFAVLSDEVRRKRYDSTGRTSESSGGMFDDAAAMGSWDAYFSAMYQKVDKKLLDEDKKRYQGSEEEISDLHAAYTDCNGSLPEIMSHIPHSTPIDEPRFINLINTAIAAGTLPREPDWEHTSTDQKARKDRVKTAKREEREAEAAAREMGIWDEFYGDGKKEGSKAATRGMKRKSGGGGHEAQDEDTSGLAALIAKRQMSRASAFDALLEKYGGGDDDDEVIEFRGKKSKGTGKSRLANGKGGKKRGKAADEVDAVTEGDLPTDEEFQRVQQKLFDQKTGDKTPATKTEKKAKR